jgi:hypothetical protein
VISERIASEALQEFISLIAVAHIANFVWYRRLIENLSSHWGRPLLIPHCTRQALLRVNSRLFQDIAEDIREVLLPSILGPILEEAKDKSNVRLATLRILQKKLMVMSSSGFEKVWHKSLTCLPGNVQDKTALKP